MGNIRGYFRNTSDLTREHFKSSQCLLTISVGQSTHEGELFAVTMDLINDCFGSCILLVDDTLQRHTMAINSPNDADFYYKIAAQEGDMWLERNRQYLNLSIPIKIMRWDTWLNHPNFQTKRNEILTLIENDLIYKSMFIESMVWR